MSAPRDLYQEVTDRIVAALEAGVAPWVPSHTQSVGPAALPRNGFSGRPFSGVNIVLLWLTAIEHGYRSPEWYTFDKACQLSGCEKDERGAWIRIPGVRGVRPHERGTLITFWKRWTVEDRETGQTKTIPLLRHYHVFNRAQIDGLPEERGATLRPEWERIAAAEALVRTTGARVVADARVPCYDVREDCIHTPPLAAYPAPAGYYVDLLHELTHWTGHPSRLARPWGGDPRSPEYAREELVAEMGSAFLCASLGIVGKLQHPEYLAGWLRVLKEDKGAVFHAASQARCAVAFLTGAPPDGPTEQTDTASDAVTEGEGGAPSPEVARTPMEATV